MPIEIPPQLANLLGYRGWARYIKIFWEKDCGLVCQDKRGKCYFSSELAFDIFAQKFSFDLGFLYLFSLQNCLLLDRRFSLLYGGDRETISRLLDEPNCLRLIEPLSVRRKRDYTSQVTELINLFSRGASFAPRALTMILVAGVITMLGSKAIDSFTNVSACQETMIKLISSYPRQFELPPPK